MNNLQLFLHLLKNIGTCSYSMQLLGSLPAAINQSTSFLFLKRHLFGGLFLAFHKIPSEHHQYALSTQDFSLRRQCLFASAVSQTPYHPSHTQSLRPTLPMLSLAPHEKLVRIPSLRSSFIHL